MFRILRSLWNYSCLTYYIIKFYNSSKLTTIKENDINQFIHKIIPYIKGCGCVCIKFAQWTTPILDNLYNDINKEPYWLKQLEKFYEQCSDHSLDYTLERYKLDFNVDLCDDYTIEDIIGSGSVGQVYKIKNKHTKIDFAMKVLHPNVYFDMWFMKKIIWLLLWIPYTHKIIYDILPIDIYSFVSEFETQIDMINEANNLCNMKYLYKDNSMIVIPHLIKCSSNILIMSYEEGESIDDSSQSEYEKYKCICLLYLFINNCLEINNFIHGDIHKGNWKMMDNKLLVYDFGFCWSILHSDKYLNDNLYTMTENVTKDNLSELITFSCHCLRNHSEKVKQDIRDFYNNNSIICLADGPLTFKMLCEVAKLNQIYIDPKNIFGIITNIQTLKYWTKYNINNENGGIPDSTNIYRMLYIDFLNICDTYDIFPELRNTMKEKLNKNQPVVTELFDTIGNHTIITDEIKNLLTFD